MNDDTWYGEEQEIISNMAYKTPVSVWLFCWCFSNTRRLEVSEISDNFEWTETYNPPENKRKQMKVIYLISLLFITSYTYAGPLSYGICQTGCNALVVACYAGAGLTFGTVTAGIGMPAAAIGCMPIRSKIS